MLRRALLHKYNGVDCKEHIPQYILEMSREELMRDAGVSLEGNTFVPQRVPVGVALEALAQHAFWTNNQLPGEKSAIRIQRGDAPGVLPYPYRYCRASDHRLTLDADIRSLIHHAFEGLLTREETYVTIADYFNREGFHNSKKQPWNKDSIRNFTQNPIHAGFFQTFNKLKNGLKDTRGEIHLYRAPFFGSPIVSLKEWKMANPVLLTRKITMH